LKASEHVEQVMVVRWFRLQYPFLNRCLWAIPNGGKRHIKTAMTLSSEGVMAGVSDLFMMVARKGYHGLFIEMKAKGGKVTQEQALFITEANKQGYLAVVCFGFDEAKKVIQDYLLINERHQNE
jgi:hypothetical protein